MTVLLTRTEEQNARIASMLEAEGIASLSWPLSRVVFQEDRFGTPAKTEALIFTSANGVHGFANACAVRDLPAFCVGTRTAAAAAEAGFGGAVTTGPDVASLLEHLRAGPLRRFFYARGKDVSADPGVELPGDFTITERIVYAAEPAGPPESEVLDALIAGRIAAISIWSRRNAEVLAEHLVKIRDLPKSAMNLVAISEKAAQPLGKSGFQRIFIAQTPDAPGMVAGISAAVRQESSGR